MKYAILRVLDGNGEGAYFVGLLTGAPSFAGLSQARRFDTREEAEGFFPAATIEALGLSVDAVTGE